MTAAKLRAVLALIEEADRLLGDAFADLGDCSALSERSKVRRLALEIVDARAGADKAEDTCRTLLRIEERYIVAKQARDAVSVS